MARRSNTFNVHALNWAATFLETPRIQVTSIGKAAYEPGGQLDINNSSGCQLFRSGYRVCFAFLDFYRANGAGAQFGNPISPFEYRENLIVQYFEKARFEWRADRPEGQRVVITDLGRTYFDLLDEDPAQLKSVNPLDATINPVLSLKVRAYVLSSVMLSSGQQTVYVVVQSQTLTSCSECRRQSYHSLARWSRRRLLLQHERCGRWEFYLQICRSKAGGTRADRCAGDVSGAGGRDLNVIQDLVLILDSNRLAVDKCFIPISFQSKTGPSLQAIFQADLTVTAHTPHSAIPPHGMGVRTRTCASYKALACLPLNNRSLNPGRFPRATSNAT